MSLEVQTRGETFTSATLSDFGEAARTGMQAAFPHPNYGARTFILCKASGTIADGLSFKKDTTSSTTVTVVVGAAKEDTCMGVNNTGKTLVAGDHFWGLREGMGYCDKGANSWSDGDQITLGAAGVFNTLGATGLGKVVGVAIVDSSTTVTSNLILFSFPGTGSAAS